MRWLGIVTVVLMLDARSASAEEWGTRDYVAASVPDPGRPWSSAELQQAVDAIARAAADHLERLPRHHSARSGPVFARLIEERPDEQTAPIGIRIAAHGERFGALGQAFKLYGDGVSRPPVREQIELTHAMLREAMAIGALSDPFLATFRADDPSLAVRRDGLAKLYVGVGEILLGSILVSADLRVPQADRLVLLRYVADAALSLFPKVPAKLQESIRTTLAKLIEGTTGELHDAAVRVQRLIGARP
jgi:hypothetical protein